MSKQAAPVVDASCRSESWAVAIQTLATKKKDRKKLFTTVKIAPVSLFLVMEQESDLCFPLKEKVVRGGLFRVSSFVFRVMEHETQNPPAPFYSGKPKTRNIVNIACPALSGVGISGFLRA